MLLTLIGVMLLLYMAYSSRFMRDRQERKFFCVSVFCLASVFFAIAVQIIGLSIFLMTQVVGVAFGIFVIFLLVRFYLKDKR